MPGLGTKIPHATEQLSPRATTTDSEHHSKSPGAATKDPAWDMEATQRSIGRRMGKKAVVHIHIVILLSYLKEHI